MCVMVIFKHGPPDVMGSRRQHVFSLIINKTDGSAWLSTPEKQEASARARGKWAPGKQGPGFHHQAPISVPCSESVVPEHNVAHLDRELLLKWKICLVIYFSKTKSSEETAIWKWGFCDFSWCWCWWNASQLFTMFWSRCVGGNLIPHPYISLLHTLQGGS